MAEHMESYSTGAETHSKPASAAPQFVVGLVMIVALLIAAAVVGQQESKSVAAATAAASAAAAAAPAAPATADAPPSKDAKAELGELMTQVKKLQSMVEELPKPEPAPDLKPIEAKIDEVGKSVAVALPLIDKVDKLDGRMTDIGKRIHSLETEAASLKSSKPGK